MKFHSEENENKLTTLISEGNVSLFAGAGFSFNLKTKNKTVLKGSVELANNLYKYIPNPQNNINKNELTEVSLELQNCLNLKYLSEIYTSECSIEDNLDKYSILNKIIFKDIYTTNFDNLLEQVLPDVKLIYREINKRNYDYDNYNNIIHLNGSINKPFFIENNQTISNLTITKKDYLLEIENELYNRFLVSLSTDYMIFIGASMYYDKELLQSISKLLDYKKLKGIYLITLDNETGEKLKSDIVSFFKKSKKIHFITGDTDSFLDWLTKIEKRKLIQLNQKKLEEIECNNYTILNNLFWDKIPVSSENELLSYYLSINSSKTFLPRVVKSNFHINPNNCLYQKNDFSDELLELPFNEIINSLRTNKPSSLFIEASGGSGKSTFIYHTSNELVNEVEFIVYDKIVSTNAPILNLDNKKPLIIVFDDHSDFTEYENNQNDFISILINNISSTYQNKKILFCFISRINDTDLIEKLSLIPSIENRVIECKLNQTDDFKVKVLKKLNLILESSKIKIQLNSKANITEQIIDYLLKNKIKITGLNFKFPWQDWDKYLKNNNIHKEFEELFKFVSFCNYYGFEPTINNCITTLRIKDHNRFLNFINSDIFNNFFQVIELNKIQLSNPNLSKLFLFKNDRTKTIRNDFANRLKHQITINNLTEDTIYILRNLYRNETLSRDLKIDIFKDTEEIINFFNTFIKNNPKSNSNSKNLFAIGLCWLIRNKDKEKAVKYFNDHISKFPNDKYVKTKLVDTLIDLNKKDEAKELLNKLIEEHSINNKIFKVLLKFKKCFKTSFTIFNYKELLKQKSFKTNLSSNEILYFSKLYIEDNDTKSALNLLELYLEDHPSNYNVNLLKSKLLFNNDLINNIEKQYNLNYLKSIEFPIYLTTQLINYLRKNKKLESAKLVLDAIDKQTYNIHTNTLFISILRDELKIIIDNTRVLGTKTIDTNLFNSYYEKYVKAIEICNNNLTMDVNHIHSHFLKHKLHRDYWIFLKGNLSSELDSNIVREFRKLLKEYSISQLKIILEKFELNKYICESIYQVIKERRRYRLGLHFYNSNIHIIEKKKYFAGMATFYNFLDNIEKFNEYNNLLKRYSKRKQGVTRNFSDFELISQDNYGYISNNDLYESSKKIILNNITPYVFINGKTLKLNINRENINNEDIYFGKYSIDNKSIINNIEPYFDIVTTDLNDNKTITELLKLK